MKRALFFFSFLSVLLSIWIVTHVHTAISVTPPLFSPTYSLNLPLTQKAVPAYPWECQRTLSPITKEYFRCKGSSLNPPLPVLKEGKLTENIFDCNGATSHSLPLRHGKEYVYPLLVELLNEIQNATGKPVIVTSGHRCPSHNRYVNPSIKNQGSKHQIGAEVSFYVAELEHHPEIVLNTIVSFYQTQPIYLSRGRGYTQFHRYERSTDVATKPWFNKELFIKLYQPHEGRNGDNPHHFPYFSLQVRFDKDTNMPVTFSWQQAQHFLRK